MAAEPCPVCGALDLQQSCYRFGVPTNARCPMLNEQVVGEAPAVETELTVPAQEPPWIGFMEEVSGQLRIGYVRDDVFDLIVAAWDHERSGEPVDAAMLDQIEVLRKQVEDERSQCRASSSTGSNAGATL